MKDVSNNIDVFIGRYLHHRPIRGSVL